MTAITRRTTLAGLAATAASASALAQSANDLILRRPPRDNEDPRWHALSQNGPFNPDPVPVIVPFGLSKLTIHKPLGPKKARLVVFSHSTLGDPRVYRHLLQHWASHGFVVVAPAHDDSVFERGLLTRRASPIGSATWEVDRVLNDALAWDARAEACRIPLEHPDLVSKAINVELDIERPIIMGHEFGAYVAQVMLGATVVDPQGKELRFVDPRWYAAGLMAPQGAGIMGLTDESWKQVTRPLMVFQGALETDFLGQTPQQKIDSFQKSAPGNKHLAWFPEGARNIYTAPRSGNQRQQDISMFEDAKAASTAFLIAYANYDEEMFARLGSDWPERATAGRVVSRYR